MCKVLACEALEVTHIVSVSHGPGELAYDRLLEVCDKHAEMWANAPAQGRRVIRVIEL